MPRGRVESRLPPATGRRNVQRQPGLTTVGNIYDAAFDDRLWPAVLNHVADYCGAWGADLVIHDPALHHAAVTSPRADPEDLARYAQTWWRHNPAVSARERLGQVAEGQSVALKRLISPADFKRTAFFNEFWRHVGPGVGWTSTRLYSEVGATAEFVLHPLRNREPFGDVLPALRPFVPHLVRAVRVQRTLRQMEMQRRMNAALAGRRFAGAMLVDAATRLVFADEASQEILSPENGLQLRGNTLTLVDHRASQTLRRLVASCAAIEIDRPMGGTFAVPRGEGRLPLELEVVPHRDDSRGKGAFGCSSPVAMLILEDPDRSRMRRAAELQRRFGLTPREASLAVEISRGDGREAAAARLGISLSTARMHLSSIFEKTGTRRQAELVRLLICGFDPA